MPNLTMPPHVPYRVITDMDCIKREGLDEAYEWKRDESQSLATRVYVEFTEAQPARDLYLSLWRRKIPVFRNWLD